MDALAEDVVRHLADMDDTEESAPEEQSLSLAVLQRQLSESLSASESALSQVKQREDAIRSYATPPDAGSVICAMAGVEVLTKLLHPYLFGALWRQRSAKQRADRLLFTGGRIGRVCEGDCGTPCVRVEAKWIGHFRSALAAKVPQAEAGGLRSPRPGSAAARRADRARPTAGGGHSRCGGSFGQLGG
eukprot:scaffold1941_cov263-Pinguiococcus_pyrenoidosus.AAC.2